MLLQLNKLDIAPLWLGEVLAVIDCKHLVE